ncbi:MAG: hypothetical protein ABR529_12555 [Actinomycetota bacterium]
MAIAVTSVASALVLIAAGLFVALRWDLFGRLNPPPGTANMVLLDVSGSTQRKTIKERYLENFNLVVGEVDAIEDEGGYLGADIIDANPIAHGTFPIRETFAPCGLLDNSRVCEKERVEARHQTQVTLKRLMRSSSRGTDIFGALSLAEDYFSARDEVHPKQLIILSDMVQSVGDDEFSKINDWSQSRIRELLRQADRVDLSGVHTYVVGAGATAPDHLSADEIDGMERFWRAYLESSGATVSFYGAALPDFPL